MVAVRDVDGTTTGHSLWDGGREDSGRSCLDAGNRVGRAVEDSRTADASTRRIADDRPSGTRTVVRPQYGADDGRGLDFFHFFAAAALRGHGPARAGFRAALRDFDFATTGRVGTTEFITFLKRHCVLLSERQILARANRAPRTSTRFDH